jgi:hypothetical protein
MGAANHSFSNSFLSVHPPRIPKDYQFDLTDRNAAEKPVESFCKAQVKASRKENNYRVFTFFSA